MARKKKSSPAEDFVVVISLVPWWLGLMIGLVSFFILHGLAAAPMVTVTNVQDVGGALFSTFVHALAQFGQYLVPLLCVIGSGASVIGRRKRANLLDGVTKVGDTNALGKMTWLEFEQMVGEWFRRQGYAITEVGGAGPDGGIDLVLRKDGEKFLVQCKQWRSMKVGVSVVRELYGVMAAERVAGGFVVTSGSFTEDAKDFANGRNVELLDGSTLVRALRPGSSTVQPTKRIEPKTISEVSLAVPKSCPVCGAKMLRRIAKRGANAGQAFWGCSNYPGCKTTLPIP